MRYEYPTQGVCPVSVAFDLNGETVTNIEFRGGCNGNLKAIAKLVDGKTVDEINDVLAGNTCGFKSTSCADQLCRVLRKARNSAAE